MFKGLDFCRCSCPPCMRHPPLPCFPKDWRQQGTVCSVDEFHSIACFVRPLSPWLFTEVRNPLVYKLVTFTMLIKMEVWGFPGGPVVGKSPSGAEGAASIPGSGAGTPHASVPKNKTKWKQCCGKFNKEFKNKTQKNGPHQKKNL